MTPLESKEVRDANGIDTFERALVYAALMLRASNTNPSNPTAGKANPYLNAARIAVVFGNVTAAGSEPLLKIEIKLPYDSQPALRQGGNFVENVKSYNNLTPTFAYSAAPTRNNIFALPSPPVWVTTLERYAVWTAVNLMGGHVSLNNKVVPPVSVTFVEEDPKEPSVSISATLKLDLFKYLDGNNLLEAVVQQVRSGTRGLSFISTSLLQYHVGGTSQSGLDYASESREIMHLAGTSLARLSDVKGQGRQVITTRGAGMSIITEQNIFTASRQSLQVYGGSVSKIVDGNAASQGIQRTVLSDKSTARIRDGNVVASSKGNYILIGSSASSVGQFTNPNANKVVLLMHMEGVNGSSNFVDEKGKIITAYGNPQIRTEQFKFGSSSGYFDGVDDYLGITYDASLSPGTGDLTWECWIRPTANITSSTPAAIFGNARGSSPGNAGLFLSIANSKLVFRHWLNGNSSAMSAQALALNNWYHVAATKVGSVLQVFLDGIKGTPGSTTSTVQDNAFNVATVPTNAGFATNYTGFIDELQVTNGAASYTENFTPPVTAF